LPNIPRKKKACSPGFHLIFPAWPSCAEPTRRWADRDYPFRLFLNPWAPGDSKSQSTRPGTYHHMRTCIGYLTLWSPNWISTAISTTCPTRRPGKTSRMSTQQRELIILLIGASGSGKSSFVKSLTTDDVRIAKSEKPCTS